MPKQSWEAFEHIRSQSFVHEARDVTPAMLVNMAGQSPHLSVLTAYAQDELLWDANRPPVKVPADMYAAAPREARVNKFGLAYKPGSTLFLHETLAKITVAAAQYLHARHGWKTVIYDALRTVDGAYQLYLHAQDSDMSSGLLSMPGTSAHNKGLAVDSMMIGADGLEVEMGGHFDHLDMATNGRSYMGDAIPAEAVENRRIREAAFLRGAFAHGLIVAPLRNEFWDDRLPENREDLWRVLDSAARAIGLRLLSEEDEKLRKTDRAKFSREWERWSYADFLSKWQDFFAGEEKILKAELGTARPPLEEKPEFYHGNYHPVYEANMPPHLQISQPR